MPFVRATCLSLGILTAGCVAPPERNPESQAQSTATTPTTEKAPHEPSCVYDDPSHTGCSSPPAPRADENPRKHFGATFRQAQSEARPLAEVLGAGQPDTEQSVLVSGKVGPVCQRRGCWMMLEDGDFKARVLMKDHAFSVPMDGQGRAALVEGTVKSRVFSQAQARHLAEDQGHNPAAIQGERREFVLTASGVRFLE